MRERDGQTFTVVAKAEDDAVPTVATTIKEGSTVHADDASHWDALHAKFLTKRINHSEALARWRLHEHGCVTSRAYVALRSERTTASAASTWRRMRLKWLGGRTTAGTAMVSNIWPPKVPLRHTLYPASGRIIGSAVNQINS